MARIAAGASVRIWVLPFAVGWQSKLCFCWGKGVLSFEAMLWTDIVNARPGMNPEIVDRNAQDVQTEWESAIDDARMGPEWKSMGLLVAFDLKPFVIRRAIFGV